ASCHRGITLEGYMDDPAIAGAHRVESDRAAGLLGLLGEPPGQLVQILLPSLPVALNVNHEAGGRPVLGAGDYSIHQVLERVECLAAPTDHQPTAVPLHVEDEGTGFFSRPYLDVVACGQVSQDASENGLRSLLKRPGRGGYRRLGRTYRSLRRARLG